MVAYINKMSGKSDLLYNLEINSKSDERAEHRTNGTTHSGVENITADHLSRWVDKNHWKLHPRFFKLIEMKWGPHSIDRMASFTNHQLK